MKFLGWLYDLSLSAWIRESDWGHPIMLCFHAIGMAMVVGVVTTLAIRVALDWPKGLTVESFTGLLRLARWGFLINLASGVVLFVANAPSLTLNFTFQLKIVLIIAGGIAVWALWRMLIGTPEKPAPQTGVFTPQAKLLSWLILLFWLGAIVSGRYIAYTLQKVFV
jgi:hypothetical protein